MEYGQPMPEYDFNVRNEAKVNLNPVVKGEKVKFLYIYDTGDSWGHETLVEKVLPPKVNQHYPICLMGKRACPLENGSKMRAKNSLL